VASAIAEPSARLRAVGELVIGGAPMADIGTDHAGLPAWLVASGRVPSAIAVDVAEGPIAAARTGAAGIAGIEVRHGDGLRPLRDGEVATVVIAGMGGARMRTLVDAGVPAGVQRLVLQPNTEWAATRAWIAARRFTLEDERMVHDRGKFYVGLAVAPVAGEAPAWDAADLELGPLLRRRGDPVWRAWVAATCETLRRARAMARAAASDEAARTLEQRLAIFESA
jgi:tRNA (adenine22-N1)-methyltransferase